jgi:hypothetical protein
MYRHIAPRRLNDSWMLVPYFYDAFAHFMTPSFANCICIIYKYLRIDSFLGSKMRASYFNIAVVASAVVAGTV